MRAKQVWSIAIAGLGLLVTNMATGALPPPPPTPCNVDTDCPGCVRCVAGGCSGAEDSGRTCMCNEECARAGQGSCDVSTTKPRCGGSCVAGLPPRALTCGAGDDYPKLEALQPRSQEVAPAVRVLEGTPVVIERVIGGAR
ncbi:hypothetical protein LVJ94_44005 [Pendulispora rubella]|uniref:Uncharacterized protein n=1 Tax=Pendulispora rubella TaxID=2741070 RepID=A0ABZ2KYV4_9BACT